jgi:hypothetical protein
MVHVEDRRFHVADVEYIYIVQRSRLILRNTSVFNSGSDDPSTMAELGAARGLDSAPNRSLALLGRPQLNHICYICQDGGFAILSSNI